MKRDIPKYLFDSEEDKKKRIKISINRSGPLVLDQFVLHPFVKIHIIDLNTCKYLAKPDPLKPGVYNNESASYYNSFKNHFECPRVDYFLSMSTSQYDLRPKAENYCSWYQSFSVDIKAEDFLKPNIVLLFEILDWSPSMILENSKKLNADLFLPIAWGFLRPIGAACQHLSDSKIQLYYYKGNHTKQRRYAHEIDLRTPEALLELNWPIKKKYPSYLEVNLSFHTDFETNPNFFKAAKAEIIEPEPTVITHFPRYPWEREVGLKEFKITDTHRKLIKVKKKEAKDYETEERIKYFKWERIKNEPCKRPNKFIRKLETEELGAFRIKFSNNGEFIAVACSFYNSRTIIKIYHT